MPWLVDLRLKTVKTLVRWAVREPKPGLRLREYEVVSSLANIHRKRGSTFPEGEVFGDVRGLG